MEVTVAPIRDPEGKIVGGVETFRDVSAALADLERAKRIQALSLETDLPADPRCVSQRITCRMTLWAAISTRSGNWMAIDMASSWPT